MVKEQEKSKTKKRVEKEEQVFICDIIGFDPAYNPGGWLKFFQRGKGNKKHKEIAKIYLGKPQLLGLIKDLMDEL